MLFFVHHDSFFSHSFNTLDKHFYTCISIVICKICWSIRSWLSYYICFSFYKSYCRHDIYWTLVAFMIAASALIKVSRLYGLYGHLYTQLIYWHCAVILYIHVNSLNKRFWILNPEWDPPGSCRSQMGPMLAPWTLISGLLIPSWRLPPSQDSVMYEDIRETCL